GEELGFPRFEVVVEGVVRSRADRVIVPTTQAEDDHLGPSGESGTERLGVEPVAELVPDPAEAFVGHFDRVVKPNGEYPIQPNSARSPFERGGERSIRPRPSSDRGTLSEAV